MVGYRNSGRFSVAWLLGMLVLAGCGGDSTGPGGGGSDQNIEVVLTITGSGGAGLGIDVRVGTRVVRVTGDANGSLQLAPGSHDVSLDGAPEWCEVDPLPSTVSAPATGLARITVRASCAGGIAYREGSGFDGRLRYLDTQGFDDQFSGLPIGTHTLETWSPDGTRVGVRTAGVRIRIWNPTTGESEEILYDGQTNHSQLSWAPDGAWVSYVLGSRAMIVRPDGTEQRPIIPGLGSDESPIWSPDGSRMAVSTDRTRSYRTLHLMNPDGTGLIEIDDRFASVLTWSADGGRIGYMREDKVAVIRTDGTDLILVADANFSSVPIFSPVRNEIGFVKDRQVLVYDLNTDQLRAVVDPPFGQVMDWSWSGNGEWIVYSLNNAPNFELGIVRRDGTDGRTIRTSGVPMRDVRWSPTAIH